MAINWTLIIAVFTVAGAVVGGLIKIFGTKQKSSCQKCFEELTKTVSKHEVRLSVAEANVSNIMDKIKEMAEDIKELLSRVPKKE